MQLRIDKLIARAPQADAEHNKWGSRDNRADEPGTILVNQVPDEHAYCYLEDVERSPRM